MAYGRITKKQTEILEYIKSQILNKLSAISTRYLYGSQFKVDFFCTCTSGNPGKEWIYPQRPYKAACD